MVFNGKICVGNCCIFKDNKKCKSLSKQEYLGMGRRDLWISLRLVTPAHAKQESETGCQMLHFSSSS